MGTIEARLFTVTVIQLSGDVILDKVELKGKDKVSLLIDKVQREVQDGRRIDPETGRLEVPRRVDLFADGGKLLKDVSIESVLEDGSTITALVKEVKIFCRAGHEMTRRYPSQSSWTEWGSCDGFRLTPPFACQSGEQFKETNR